MEFACRAGRGAVIFDMDGVLVDSYDAHLESWRTLAAEEGLSFSERDFAERLFGRTSRDIIGLVWKDAPLEAARVEELDERKEALFREIVSRDFPEMDGARELIEGLRAAGFRLAVGSSGPPENIDLVLDRLGGRQRFNAVVTGSEVQRGKPDPQVFLLAAERLGVRPDRCVVIEDAPAGIEAAARAGMPGVALLSTGRRAEQFGSVRPALLVRSLRELTPARLETLLEAPGA